MSNIVETSDINKKRVGILSYWTSSENYGQILQLYATCTLMKNWGYEPYIIKYDCFKDPTLKRATLKRAISLLLHPERILPYLRILRNPPEKFESRNALRRFDKFKSMHFNWSREYLTYPELIHDAPEADVYIAGSDMVWSAPNIAKPYFLNFGSRSVKRIAYAPSFGRFPISKDFLKVLPEELQCLDGISVREKSGVEILESLGLKNVLWVPDPTLLHDKNVYMDLVADKHVDQVTDYLFTYFLGNSVRLKLNDIANFAAKESIDIQYTSAHERVDDYPQIYPTIEEWLDLIAGAKYVLTNSFHGIAFCIIFQKQFLYVPHHYYGQSTNERAFSLLERLGLSDRIWNDNINSIKKAIDYGPVNERLDVWRNEGFEFLKRHIG